MNELTERYLGELEKLKDMVDPEDRQFLAELLLQYAELTAKLHMGEDVEEDLRIVKNSLNAIYVGMTVSALEAAQNILIKLLTSLIAKI